MTTSTPPLTKLETALAATFKGERNAAGLSLDQMAEATGLNRQVYYRLETGQRHASMAQIEKVADALGVTVAWLIKDASDRADRAAAAAGGGSPAPKPTVTVAKVTATVPRRSQAAASRRSTPESRGQDLP
jgi:transcriptional regulator with XRE-family HTH domain